MKKYLLLAIVFFFLSLFVHPANAHFLFVYGEDGKVKVVFGEGTDPDQAQFLGGLKSMKAFTFSGCLLYTSPSPRDQRGSRMPSSA